MSAQRIQLGPFFYQGAICGGALLEHYEAGTSTLKNIWSDAAMTTTLAQPFVSDANGIFNFFADGYYKLVVKKSDGQVLHTLDNWKMVDSEQASISSGSPTPTASTVTAGDAYWAHWTGSVNVAAIIGTAPFYWAVADGSFTLIHSSSLIMPDSRNRKVNSGDVLFFVNEGTNIYRLGGQMEKEGGWKGRQGGSVSASSTITVPSDGDFIDISGSTGITGISSASGGYRFRARFTGTGLNLTHNGTSFISPWGRTYRTIQNEVLEFTSLGAGNWIFWSVNGPRERIGTVITSGDPTGTQTGYLACDGSAVSRATYAGLYDLLGTTFGAGDGSTTFNVPDIRGRAAIMVDGSAGRITASSTGGSNADTLGGAGGAETHTLILSETPAHTHTYTAIQNTAGAVAAAGSDKGSVTTATTSQGGDGAHSNTQPWIALNMYIRF